MLKHLLRLYWEEIHPAVKCVHRRQKRDTSAQTFPPLRLHLRFAFARGRERHRFRHRFRHRAKVWSCFCVRRRSYQLIGFSFAGMDAQSLIKDRFRVNLHHFCSSFLSVKTLPGDLALFYNDLVLDSMHPPRYPTQCLEQRVEVQRIRNSARRRLVTRVLNTKHRLVRLDERHQHIALVVVHTCSFTEKSKTETRRRPRCHLTPSQPLACASFMGPPRSRAVSCADVHPAFTFPLGEACADELGAVAVLVGTPVFVRPRAEQWSLGRVEHIDVVHVDVVGEVEGSAELDLIGGVRSAFHKRTLPKAQR
ncbi:hypothetical protein GQ600_4557 [Phytophthora cactorum]|nr:hypothetical protein GQ600_4557 [Phytophthora cactorum]